MTCLLLLRGGSVVTCEVPPDLSPRGDLVMTLCEGVHLCADGLTMAVEALCEGTQMTDTQLLALRGALAEFVLSIDAHFGSGGGS